MDSISLHDTRSPAPGAPTSGARPEGAFTPTESERHVLAVLAQEEGLTRAELAKRADLPRSTVGAAVRRLLGARLVEEHEHASSTGGRRPTLLRRTRSDGAVLVGELGANHARLGLASLSGELLATSKLDLEIDEGQDAIVERLRGAWQALEDKSPSPVLAVGLGVPGPVDEEGRVTGAARMPGWNGLDLAGALREATGHPAVIENDARASAIGEWSRRGEHHDSCMYIKAGTGIGAGWISGGVAHRGAHGFAGDLTHTRIKTEHPRPCSCGNAGCLETVASGAAILRQLAEAGRTFDGTEDIIATANNGDPQVTALVRDAGARIGEVLSGLVNFLNPKRIVIGGSMSQMGALLAGLRTELYDRCLPMCTERLSIETSLAGADAPLIGMAILARQSLHHQPRSTS